MLAVVLVTAAVFAVGPVVVEIVLGLAAAVLGSVIVCAVVM